MSPPISAAPAQASTKKAAILAAVTLALAGAGVVGYRQLVTGGADEHVEPVRPAVVIDPGVIDLDPFVVRLGDPAGDRYFRLNLRLVLDQKTVAQRANVGLGQVKLVDLVLEILSKKRARELVTVDGKEALREELRTAVNTLLAQEPLYDAAVDPAPASVSDVFFTEFLVQ